MWLTALPQHLKKAWDWVEYKDVKWLNAPEAVGEGSLWEDALVNTVMDGDFGEDVAYAERYKSHVVILVHVPKMIERNLTVND
jgi:hypothetical protein